MIVKSKNDKDTNFPQFKLCGGILEVCSETRYLGHYFTDDLKDDKDILRQRQKLYIQGNTLIRKFHMCTYDVKVSLFRAYCTPLYTAHLWCKYTKTSMSKLTTAYNEAMRRLLRIPRNDDYSASGMFVRARVPACEGVIRNLIYKFMQRIEKSRNSIINVLVDPTKSSTRYTSHLWKNWYQRLHEPYENFTMGRSQ